MYFSTVFLSRFITEIFFKKYFEWMDMILNINDHIKEKNHNYHLSCDSAKIDARYLDCYRLIEVVVVIHTRH